MIGVACRSEDDLTFPLDGLSAPIATTTADGRVDFTTGQLLDYLGMSLEELKNWETSGAIHPDDLSRVVTAWRQSVERCEPHEGEQRIRRADGVTWSRDAASRKLRCSAIAMKAVRLARSERSILYNHLPDIFGIGEASRPRPVDAQPS